MYWYSNLGYSWGMEWCEVFVSHKWNDRAVYLALVWAKNEIGNALIQSESLGHLWIHLALCVVPECSSWVPSNIPRGYKLKHSSQEKAETFTGGYKAGWGIQQTVEVGRKKITAENLEGTWGTFSRLCTLCLFVGWHPHRVWWVLLLLLGFGRLVAFGFCFDWVYFAWS